MIFAGIGSRATPPGTITVLLRNGVRYAVARSALDAAVLAWDQWRSGHRDVDLNRHLVQAKCREIAARIQPSTYEDYWATERLARCLMHVIGQRRGNKQSSEVPSLIRVRETQLELF